MKILLEKMRDGNLQEVMQEEGGASGNETIS